MVESIFWWIIIITIIPFVYIRARWEAFVKR